jgi:hypothetical protein
MFMGASAELLWWIIGVIPVSIILGVIIGNVIGAIKYPNPEQPSIMGTGAKITIVVAVLLTLGMLAASFMLGDFGRQSTGPGNDMFVSGFMPDDPSWGYDIERPSDDMERPDLPFDDEPLFDGERQFAEDDSDEADSAEDYADEGTDEDTDLAGDTGRETVLRPTPMPSAPLRPAPLPSVRLTTEIGNWEIA